MWIAVDCLHPNMRCSGARRNFLGGALRSTLRCWIKTRELSRNLRMGLRPRTSTFMEKEARYSWKHLQDNRTRPKPVTVHPLGEILAKWAGLAQPDWKAPALVELREMDGDKGKFVFLYNHGEKAAQVEFAQAFERPAVHVREIVTGETWKTGKTVHEDGSSGAGSADLPDRLSRLAGGTTRRRGRHLVGLRACPWFSWRAGKCE